MGNSFKLESRAFMSSGGPISVSAEKATSAAVAEVMKKLSSRNEGLSSAEAERRLKQYGANEIPEKKVDSTINSCAVSV
jgi:magnesium-transporting ATPase (P-type)